MVFDYYNRLSAKRQSIYRQSDQIRHLRLPNPDAIRPIVSDLEAELTLEDRGAIETACQRIADAVVSQLKAPGIKVEVLQVRPSDDWGELHGLYLPEEDAESAKIQLWMRTVKHKRVVAFRTFLRTLLHELCHHLDYEVFEFPETFHTEGFYNRESSLFHQLISESQGNDNAPQASKV